MAKKRKSLSKVKKEAWVVFAKLVKLSSADDQGYCYCYTCGQKMIWNARGCNAGHFQVSTKSNTRYDPMNVKAQCVNCNCSGSGEQYLFGLHLDEEYGPGTSDDIVRRSNIPKQYRVDELEDLMVEWKKELRKLGLLID